MAKIQVLPEHVVRKIAAGEVIEGPASVVKELVENAIDARACRVHIELKGGGRQLISVSDDGVGMGRRDARLCARPYATSKMRSASDLFTLATLGFRGEALSSIGAISRLTIDTRAADESEATRVVVEGGVEREFTLSARAPGTTVAVRDIFFNTPARRKFLRHIDTEVRHIVQVVSQLAAAYPQVGFELVHQERTVLSLLPGQRRQRAAKVLDLRLEEVLCAAAEEEGLCSELCLSPPEHCRRSRGRQYIVVRGRPIVAPTLKRALYDGYGGLLPSQSHPSFILWLELDSRQVDVNVHPTKSEIRFADEGGLCRVIGHLARRALGLIEGVGFSYEKTDSEFKSARAPGDSSAFIARPAGEVEHLQLGVPEEDFSVRQTALSFPPSPTPRAEQCREGFRREGPAPVRLWPLHKKYILAAVPEGLVLIDRQAAHERVLYEEALDKIGAEGLAVQQLLFPLTIEVGAVEMELILEAQGTLEKLGFVVRPFGCGTALVESVPLGLKNWDAGALFHEMLSDMVEEREMRNSLRESMVAAYARRASIKAGQRMAPEEMKELVEHLFHTRESFISPQGRPIMVKIDLAEIDRMFKRRK